MKELDLGELQGRATRAAQAWAPGCAVRDIAPLEGGTVGLVYSAEVHDGPAEQPRLVLNALHRVDPEAAGLGDDGVDSGMPCDAELLAAYEAVAGAPVRDLDWFHALTRYKEAAAMALIAKHAARRGDENILARMAVMLPALIADAHHRVR